MRYRLLLALFVLSLALPSFALAQDGGGSGGSWGDGSSSGGSWGDPPADRATATQIAWYYGYAQCYESVPVSTGNGWSVDFPSFTGYRFRVLNDWYISPDRYYFGASPSRPLIVVASPWHPLPSITIWRHWSLPINAFLSLPHPLGVPLTQVEYITIDAASIMDVWSVYLCDYAQVVSTPTPTLDPSGTPTPTPSPSRTPTATTMPYQDYECWQGQPFTSMVNSKPYITIRFPDAVGVLFTSAVETTEIYWRGRYAYALPPGRSFLLRVDPSIQSSLSLVYSVAWSNGFPPSGVPVQTLPYGTLPAVYENTATVTRSIEFRGGYASDTPYFSPDWASLVELCVPRSYFPSPTPQPSPTSPVGVTRTVVWTPTATRAGTPTRTPTVTRTPTRTPTLVPSPSPVSTSATYVNTIVPIALTPLPDGVDTSGSLIEDVQIIFDGVRRLLAPGRIACNNLPVLPVPAPSPGGFAAPSARDVLMGVCSFFELVSPVTHWARPMVTVMALVGIVLVVLALLRSAAAA